MGVSTDEGTWEIWGRYNGAEAELIDEIDGNAEAQRVQGEYELAFDSEWFLYRRRIA